MPVREPFPCATSADKLRELNRSPAEYACCARPQSGESKEEIVLGCGKYARCKSHGVFVGREGPRNYGVRMMIPTTQGVGVREQTMACYAIVDKIEEVDTIGGYMEVIAVEGEEIQHARGTRRVPPDLTLGETHPREVDEYDRVEKVPAHPRDENHPGLVAAGTLQKIRMEEAARKREAKRTQFVGEREPLKDEGEPVEVPGNHDTDVRASGDGQQPRGKGPRVSSDLGRPPA